MSKPYKTLLLAIVIVTMVIATACHGTSSNTGVRAIYHWKNVFAPTQRELAFLNDHNINKIYIKFFEVDCKNNVAIPIVTTRFDSLPPQGVAVVPTVFLTLNALKAMQHELDMGAKHITNRILNMVSYYGIDNVDEVQLDCDWTPSTEQMFFDLCLKIGELLHKKNIKLSCTIRLHQLRKNAPPVDCGTLMVYNTGAIKQPSTRNSILDINDVKPYFKRRIKYPLPLSIALPAYSWGVLFDNNEFVKLISSPQHYRGPENMRIERSNTQDVNAVKNLLNTQLLNTPQHFVIYHWDESQLNEYTHHQIENYYD